MSEPAIYLTPAGGLLTEMETAEAYETLVHVAEAYGWKLLREGHVSRALAEYRKAGEYRYQLQEMF